MKFEIIANDEIIETHNLDFGKLLEKQGKVVGRLNEKARRCKIICIVYDDLKPIAIGAVKPKTTSDFTEEKADLMGMSQYLNGS